MSSIPTICGAVSSFSRGKTIGIFGVVVGVRRLPTDPVGLHTLTLNNVAVGSRISVRDQAGTTTLYDQIAATPTVEIILDAYSPGAPLNDWRIRVRKGSGSPNYIPYETLLTGYVGASAIYVSQIPDE